VIEMIAAQLPLALRDLAPLPGKFGFAVDCGPQPVLGAVSADIRIERSGDGSLILRPDGHGLGRRISAENAVSETVLLAKWFLSAGGVTAGRGRMAQLIARGILPDGCTEAAADPLPQPLPGPCADGLLVAFAFGQMQADKLLALANCDHTLILTPWRMILLQGAQSVPADPALITRPDDPLLRVTACTGAPGCAQAIGPTRALARDLATITPHHLHVSGCAKGCAHPGTADLTLVATPNGYNLIRGGAASDSPFLRDLPPHLIPDALHAP
jgi:precorrin-3B synthase